MADREGDKLASYRVGKEETGPTVTETDGRCKFVSLHHHTTYSYMDGFGTTEQHSEAAAQRGQTALAVTEHGNVSSHPTHARRCEERGVKPLFGCELYTGYPDVAKKTEKNPLGIQTKKNHLTVIAGDNTGYRNLLELVSLSWRDGFARFPTSLPDMIDDHADGLIVLSGCTASELACSLVGGKEIDPAEASYARAKKVARRMKKQFGDRFFLEVQMLPELDEVRAINQAYQELSRELRIPLVGTADVHYPDPDDGEMRRIMHAVGRGGRDVDEVGQEWDYSVDSSLPLSDRAVLRRLMATGLDKKAARSALSNTARIADMANVELPRMPMVEFPIEDGYEDSEEMYWAWLDEGWHKRGFNRLSRRDQIRYRRRIKYESGLIAGKGFVDYFLIVADMCKFAKGSGIPVGPARGSAAASLVCYLLDITEVNPMDFPHLVFERFIDATRKDLPDIDLDFDDELRVEVFNYMTRKYGPEYTGMIGTFTFYKSKNSLDDVARVNGIPPWEVDKVKDVMIERSSGDLRASATIEDTIEYFDQAREVFENHPALGAAMKLEGNVKGMGVHSAGLVIAPEPLTNVCAVYTRQGKTDRSEVISMDKYSAEEMGMLKIDVLGLSTMGMLRVATELLGWSLQDLYDIPLDDPETIEGFRENDVVGIFQFDGWAMRLVNQELKPDSFTEVCDVNALARPGPLHNGASSEYIDIKMGNKEPRRYHPLVDDITRHTNYQIVYQEQILRIVMEVGKFEWTHAAYIRKIISKKIGEQEFARQGDTFLKGAVENGLEESVAKEVWGDLITAGSYAFNSAHCVAYGMLAWWCMYIKRHHPLEFFTAALRKLPDGKKLALLKDAVRHDIAIEPPDPVLSERTWQMDEDEGSILAGFEQIPGIGEATAEAILETRERAEKDGEPWTGWSRLIDVKGIGPKSLEKCMEFVEQDDPFEIHLLTRRLRAVKDAILSDDLPCPMPTHTSLEVPYARTGKDMKVVWAGEVLERNLRDLFEVNLSRTGIPLDPDEVKAPDKAEWLIMRARDDEEQMMLTIDRWKYPRMKAQAWSIRPEHDIVIVKGTKRGNQSARRIYIEKMWVVDPEG